jgi:hypothetical protein
MSLFLLLTSALPSHTRIRAQYSWQRNMLNIRQMQVHIAAESCSPLHLHPPAYIYTRNIGRLYFYFYSFHYWKRTPSFSFLFSFLFVFVITVVSLGRNAMPYAQWCKSYSSPLSPPRPFRPAARQLVRGVWIPNVIIQSLMDASWGLKWVPLLVRWMNGAMFDWWLMIVYC